MSTQPEQEKGGAAMQTRAPRKCHAHFDCFSGAAGDMMMASCLDASEDAERLLDRIVHSIRKGMPPIADEFEVRISRVWRGSGSISALHVTIKSVYEHQAAPVPAIAVPVPDQSLASNHSHSHEHELHASKNDSTEHKHSHSGRPSTNSGGENQTRSHSHDHHIAHNHSHEHQASQDRASRHEDATHGHHHAHAHSSGHDHAHENGTRKGPLRNLPEIRSMLQNAREEYIPEWVRNNAIEAFTELAKAEASVHGASGMDAVHFHEVGAVDSIVDTVGTLLGLYFLGVESVSCSPLPLGEGTVWTDHGILPVPAPATLRLMIGMRTTPGPPGVTGELVTPTAAALLRVLTKVGETTQGNHSGRPPRFTIRSAGVGAGTKDFQKHPNILRLMLGDDLVLDDRKYNA